MKKGNALKCVILTTLQKTLGIIIVFTDPPLTTRHLKTSAFPASASSQVGVSLPWRSHPASRP